MYCSHQCGISLVQSPRGLQKSMRVTIRSIPCISSYHYSPECMESMQIPFDNAPSNCGLGLRSYALHLPWSLRLPFILLNRNCNQLKKKWCTCVCYVCFNLFLQNHVHVHHVESGMPGTWLLQARTFWISPGLHCPV